MRQHSASAIAKWKQRIQWQIRVARGQWYKYSIVYPVIITSASHDINIELLGNEA